jgi:alpha-amylase/alpha-mannosidase (GH57 family)
LIERYVCIHGHFYQPPRENPWLGVVEVQDGAAPFHDWNERITAECYRPNARSRILDDEGWIAQILNNYSRMSFNFGPTLLSWLETEAPDVYTAIQAADRHSIERYGGHGSAIAQCYGHMIMPLANSRDKRTQVVWGIADFEHRFGRRPEGMWLPETAADLETLDILAAEGIAFTVLAPNQAGRVRALGVAGPWRDVSDGSIDPRRPYVVNLPSGRRIAVFFYDGPTSRAVAFEGLLSSGESFAARLEGIFDEKRGEHQLAHIATDGETYGHHHRFGDMALAYVLDRFETTGEATLTNYGQYLELFPPQHEVEIIENTSWSCAHGVERWRSDCGDSTGGRPGWNQAWRAPLRDALDWLRTELDRLYVENSVALLKDPWAARDGYVSVVIDRSPANIEAFLTAEAARPLDALEKTRVLKLLEMQNHAMLMFTSCGWFFNDISGIETVQVLMYAARAAQLAQEVSGEDLEAGLTQRLAGAKSNLPEEGDGRKIYERYARSAKVDLAKVLSHYAVSSMFEDYGYRSHLFQYTVDRQDFKLEEAGHTKLALGLAKVQSVVTLEERLMSFGVVHLGDQNISGGTRDFTTAREYNDMVRELRLAFNRGDLTDVVHTLDRAFPQSSFSLRSLFRDEQRKVVRLILQPALDEAEAVYRSFYEEHIPLFRFLTHIDFPLPNRFHAAADLALQIELRRNLARDDIDPDMVSRIFEEARLVGITIDREGMGFELQQTIERLSAAFRASPADPGTTERLRTAVDLAQAVGLPVDLASAQNVFYEITHSEARPAMAREAQRSIELLAGSLRVRLPAAEPL